MRRPSEDLLVFAFCWLVGWTRSPHTVGWMGEFVGLGSYMLLLVHYGLIRLHTLRRQLMGLLA